MAQVNSDSYTLVSEDDFQLSEAYKVLRTNLEFSILNSKHKTILITSSAPSEGKSNIVANLGFSLTQIGYKVLLIDCDLRKPKLHKFFNLRNNAGLTNVIFKRIELEAAIKEVGSNYYLMNSGSIPPNSVEILNSKEMKEIINTVAEKYDYILIDTPPSAYLSDASVLIPNTDGVLFVIK
jgi:capsular exopolysaccharide synthesis family protein